METTPKNEQKQLTEQERFNAEIAAINLLDQLGVSFSVPLRKEEIASIKAKNSFLNKILHRKSKSSLPQEIEVKSRKMPNPLNPQEEIEYYEAEISIRPLRLATIDAIRSVRLKLQLKDPQFITRLESTDPNDTYLQQYSKEILEAVAIATINEDDTRKYRTQIEQWVEFYRRHLTNQRYMKLAQVVMMMMDAPSFRASTRLILGLGTTAPREANRVEKAQSKA